MSPNLQISGEGSESNSYAILVSILGTIPLLLTIILCACWKRTRQKDELMGLPGIVKPTNPDENVIDITINPPILNGTLTIDVIVDDVDSNKRPTSMAKHHRSLPDIPNITDLTQNCEPNGDNSSDLYATVHPSYNTAGSSMTDQQSSICQTDDPYSRVENGIKKTENPYAVVNENSKLNELSICSENGAENSATVKLQQPSSSSKVASVHFSNPTSISHAPIHPHAPPPLPSPTNSSGGVSSTIRISNNNNDELNPPVDEISAARAMRGDVPLPYMTPPTPNNGLGREPPNFSGDSQDSSKGYTSITVRAPIKDIIKASDATYSDDSDEMYQTIPDANNQSTYTSGSETYAQIQPQITIAVEINNPQLQQQADLDYNNQNNASNHEINKQSGHSRQGSNSSSIQNLGSPKPEKRPANSPLPPTPSSVASTSNLDKPIQNVNDMYAKVVKKPKRTDNDESKNPSSTPPLDKPSRDINKFERKIEHNYETIKKSSPKQSQPQNSLDSDPGYEKLQPRTSITEPGYETLNPNNTALESMDSEPNYEQLRPKSPSILSTSNMHNNSAASSITSNQQLTVDGYSLIRHGCQSNQSSVSSDILTGTNTRNSTSLEEPNYESMPNSENSDMSCDLNDQRPVEYKQLKSDTENDLSILQKRRSYLINKAPINLQSLSNTSDDIDPNYESLKDHNNLLEICKDEPNYESVKYDDVSSSGDKKLLLSKKDSSNLMFLQETEGYDDGYERIKKNKADKIIATSNNDDYETIRKVVENSGEGSKSGLREDDIFEV